MIGFFDGKVLICQIKVALGGQKGCKGLIAALELSVKASAGIHKVFKVGGKFPSKI